MIVAAIVVGAGAAWMMRRAHAGAASAVARRPDVLLITIDTLRADAVGAYGHAGNPTPWIDRLAAAGIRFDAAHAQAPLTLPSHTTILTGRYPFAHGVRDNAGFRLPTSIPTLATWLHAQGYRTGAFVSAFPLDERFGLARGFDIYDDRVSTVGRAAFLEPRRDGRETVAHARAWLDAAHAQPSFCWVHIFEPHYPYAPPEPFASRFAGDPYEGAVAAADAALAPLLAPVLNRPGDRTIVVLTGDHGESLGEHGEATHGIFAYESTLRVPLVIRAPGAFSAGTVGTEARHVDVAPTILDLLAIDLPGDLDGRTLRRQPDAPASETTYFEALSGAFNRGWAPLRGVIRGRLKYIDLPIPELYDLSTDPGEMHNLASGRSADVQRLKRVLDAYPSGPEDPRAEPADARARLQSLGYTAGGRPIARVYTADDDPKRLIGIDRDLHDVVAKYLAGDLSAALDAARAIAARYPRMPLAWLELADLERRADHLSAGIEALQHAFAIDRTNTQVAALLGAYLTENGRPADAVAALTPLAQAPDPDVEVLRALALATARLGRTDAALELLRRARSLDAGEPQLLVDEGTALLMANRRAEAHAAFEDALARDPDNPRAESSLAAMAIDEGRAAEAAAYWRRAVARDPSEIERIFALGVAEARAGRTAQARAALEFFVEAAAPARDAGEISRARAWLDHTR